MPIYNNVVVVVNISYPISTRDTHICLRTEGWSKYTGRVRVKRSNATLAEHLSQFRNEFNNVYNTGARMLDSDHHMTLNLLWNCIFGVKKVTVLEIKADDRTGM